jgi:opacity protein-like surface antigen
VSQTSMSPPAVADPLAVPGAPPVAAAPAPQQYLYGKTDRHPLYLELGYGLTPNILLGAILQFAGSSETLEANGGKAPVSDSLWTLAPKFDYQFTPTSRLNPFLGGVVSLTMHDKKSGPYTDSRLLFGLGVRGGVRYFVLDQLSFDPSLSLGLNFGSGTQKQDAAQPVEFEDSLSGWYLSLGIGVSLYIK